MMDEVLIPYGEDPSKTATNLLAAAEALDQDPSVVRHQPDDGGFRVPEDVAEAAGLAEPDEPEHAPDEEPQPKARKTAAKKAAAKKSASSRE